MKNQYLILAENITYKNNKLSCINIMDQFVGVTLPADFLFDMVIICGPGWAGGNYDLSIKVKSDVSEMSEIGNIKVEIPNDNFVYNALAPGMKISVGNDIKTLTFMVYRNDELIIERNYPVSSLFVATAEPANQA